MNKVDKILSKEMEIFYKKDREERVAKKEAEDKRKFEEREKERKRNTYNTLIEEFFEKKKNYRRAPKKSLYDLEKQKSISFGYYIEDKKKPFDIYQYEYKGDFSKFP